MHTSSLKAGAMMLTGIVNGDVDSVSKSSSRASRARSRFSRVATAIIQANIPTSVMRYAADAT